MGKFGRLAVSFVKRQYYPHLLLTLLFVAFSGGFVSFKGLDALGGKGYGDVRGIYGNPFIDAPFYAGAG